MSCDYIGLDYWKQHKHLASCPRVAGFTYFNAYIVDQDVGFSLRPNAEGWWRKEGLTYVKINSQRIIANLSRPILETLAASSSQEA